ncbi:hypothetical protein DRO91_08130 [Candidatus Heimdallarchaeota archaeon]|nr:MAG: hypothetical protein DRO91_08130 [Candidatus Heimdallarchaeota archaeon]
MLDEKKFLSLFLGPKAENANYLEEVLLLVLRDYFHWRRNYFPGDKILVTKELQRELEHYYDRMYQNTIEMTAKLRRNFPFYSSRYIAHMLSDTLLPSMIGYLAGMLYNPNNVTPEAAPVTVDMEIEACNEIIKMLGFTPPPNVPNELSHQAINDYKKKLQKEFGWAHLTLGGTIANIEALWVARTIKYTPLSILDVSKQEDLEITIKLPGGSEKDIRRFTRRQILSIKPNEAIYLLAKYVDAIRIKHNISVEDAGNKAHSLLQQSKYSINKGLGKIFSEFPPVIFVSGTAHYSISKAADILGIGKENIEIVRTDSQYRLSVEHLEQKIKHAIAQKRIPLAVVAIAGTTEEGAVDPIHHIQDLREKFEKASNISFWLHIDAAWGGYIRSVFNLSETDYVLAIQRKISNLINIDCSENTIEWNEKFLKYIENNISSYAEGKVASDSDDVPKSEIYKQLRNNLEQNVKSTYERLNQYLELDDYKSYVRALAKFVNDYKEVGLANVVPSLLLRDRIELVNDYVSDEVTINWGKYHKKVWMQWGSKEVCSAFIGFSKADSITIDPHKMGYVNYPCGMISFRNDRIRHFVLQKAPYITSVRQDVLVHMPPSHIENLDGNPKIVTEAFAPFIIEGSRPGAAASSLWATVKTVPPTMREAGLIVRSSLLAARELYEWLVHWDTLMEYNKADIDFKLIPLTLLPPDTNVVIFGIKKKTSNALAKMNELTQYVYEHFTIQSELGDREYSYSQPFFLSKTVFHEPNYSFNAIKPIFDKHFSKGHTNQLLQDYQKDGLIVLRATVMNPYISLTRKLSEQNVIKEFMEELLKAAKESVKKI